MQQHLFTLTLLAGLIIATGCNQQPFGKTEKVTLTKKDDCGQAMDNASLVLCHLTTAREHTGAYDRLWRRQHGKDATPIHAFTIRAVDLLAALGMSPTLADDSSCRFKHIRVYMGYDSLKAGFKLYIVPVDGACLKGENSSMWYAGTDVFLDKHATPVMAVDSGSNGMASTDTYVLDLNAPCPNTCPKETPLTAP
jgi:hypothetical protein